MKNILFIGDIIGKPGRDAVRQVLSSIKKEYSIDLVIANGENSSGGSGINEKRYNDLIETGIDVITLGNHIWNNKDFIKDIAKCPLSVRPANFPEGTPGTDRIIKDGVCVLNVLGRVFMKEMDCPFRAIDRILGEIDRNIKTIIVDIHAEATSEKSALGWYLDGRATAVIGTHTHVQTADERILPAGTAFITDAGMVGPMNSVIGVDKDAIVERFLTCMPKKFEVAKNGPCIFNAVVISSEEETGRAVSIKRINRVIER